MSFHREDHTIAVAGGGGSFVTDHPWRGVLWNTIVEPTTSSNTYLLSVTDEKGDEVISWDQTTPADPNNVNSALEMPARGSYTWTLSAVGIDEPVRIRTIVREFPY